MSSSDSQARLIGGRYRLDRSIGRGGMGTVWQGRDEVLGREVAVKEVRFPPGLSAAEQQDLRQRTLREARATARLSHPNVVTTYDVVEEDDRPWIVMELINARSLSQVLRDDGPLPPHRVAEIGLAMLGALEVSHKQGIVHRDVKPGNVLVTEDGRAVLTDFGIATMAGDPSLTSTGVVLGSPAYMSPERARGQRPGAAADLWSLGATLYAAVEGRPPFDSDNAIGTLTAVISDPVRPPSVSGPLGEAILGLLEKDPAERMPVGQARTLLKRAATNRTTKPTPVPAEAAVALDRASRTQALPIEPHPTPSARAGEPAPPPPPAPTSPRPTDPAPDRRRKPVAAAVAGVAVLALLAVLGVAALTNSGTDTPAQTPRATGTQTSGPTGAAPTTTTAPSPSTSTATATATSSSPASGGLPAGFRLHRDRTGFAVAVPEGWRESRRGSRVDFRDPSGSRFLRIDQTSSPGDDPKKDWQRQERSVRDRLPNYQRIRIEDVTYRGYPAADWEFTFGGGTHVLNRGFVTGPDHGYALYLSTPGSQWDQSQQVLQVAARSFRPAS
jgi:eukaryotic-like serine/threonine-protein kinase